MAASIFQSPVISNEICSLSMVRRIAAMLDLETSLFSEGDLLPKGWHFFLLAGETRKSDLRKDGFPGLGVPIPDLGFPRLLLGSRTVTYHGDILIGSIVEKTSFVKNIEEKTGKNGAMAIVQIQHEIRTISDSNLAIIENQTYILKPFINESIKKEEKEITKETSNQFLIHNFPISNVIIPDETLLFQYSALGFNSHKIHIDRDYAKNVEGLPDLVVNGGLTSLLMTEFASNDLSLNLFEIKIKYIAPLYCNCALTIVLEESQLKIYNDKNELAVVCEFLKNS
jgi:3-methylfumaryl-CoA hydratase